MKRITSREHIAHVIPQLTTCGITSFAATLAYELPRYQHTLVYETPVNKVDLEIIARFAYSGCEALQVDNITHEFMEANDFTAAMLYNVVDHTGLGTAVPSIYYSYGVYDPLVGCKFVMPCSTYAATQARYKKVQLDTEWVVPPAIHTRAMRRLRLNNKNKNYAVGILTSGAYDKYPCKEVIELLNKLPADITVYMTTLPKYSHIGIDLAIAARKEVSKIVACPVRFAQAVYYALHCDVVICASNELHHEPYGRLMREVQAAGVPVICENRGIYTSIAKHGWNAFIYNNTDEIIEYINKLRKDTSLHSNMSANAQLSASWEDITVHLGKYKKALKVIGI